jgi:hypothetical protein
MTVIDSVDVSDICADVDEIAIFDDRPGRHRARAFVEDGTDGMMIEATDVDLTDYPAVVAVARRGLDVDAPITFESLPVADHTDDPGLDHDR